MRIPRRPGSIEFRIAEEFPSMCDDDIDRLGHIAREYARQVAVQNGAWGRELDLI